MIRRDLGKGYVYIEFTEKSLSRLSIDELVELAKRRRSCKHSFKKSLVDYLVKVGDFK